MAADEKKVIKEMRSLLAELLNRGAVLMRSRTNNENVRGPCCLIHHHLTWPRHLFISVKENTWSTYPKGRKLFSL